MDRQTGEMVGMAHVRLCPPYEFTKLRSSRGFQRLRRVNVEKRALAIARDFGYRLGVLGDQMARADIAVERHQFPKESPRPQHGIAAAAVADGDGDKMAAVRRK